MGDFRDIGIGLNILLTDTDISVSVYQYQSNSTPYLYGGKNNIKIAHTAGYAGVLVPVVPGRQAGTER